MGLHRDWTGLISAGVAIGGGLLLCLFDGTTRIRDWHLFWFPAWALTLATCLSLRAAVYLSDLDEKALEAKNKVWSPRIEEYTIVEPTAIAVLVFALVDAIFALREPTNPITIASFPTGDALILPPDPGGKYGSTISSQPRSLPGWSRVKSKSNYSNDHYSEVYGENANAYGTDASGRPVYLTQTTEGEGSGRPVYLTQTTEGERGVSTRSMLYTQTSSQAYGEHADDLSELGEEVDQFGRPVIRPGVEAL